MPRPPLFVLVLASLALGCSGGGSTPTKVTGEVKTNVKAEPPVEMKQAKLVVTPPGVIANDEAEADADAKEATPPALPPKPALPAMYARERGGKLEVEILVDTLSERDGTMLAELAAGEIGERTKLSVAPGDAKLPAPMRPTALTVIDADGVATAKVIEVAVGQGPSGPHGLLVLERAAKPGAHALALVGPAKHAAAQLKPIVAKPLGKTDEVRTAAIAAAKASVTEAEGANWAAAQLTSLEGIAKPQLGGLYLLTVEIPEGGGVLALYGNKKDGGVEPLVDAAAEGILAPLGAVDLDGDGTDEILAALDAFEGAYVKLFVWNAETKKYDGITIAGDGA